MIRLVGNVASPTMIKDLGLKLHLNEIASITEDSFAASKDAKYMRDLGYIRVEKPTVYTFNTGAQPMDLYGVLSRFDQLQGLISQLSSSNKEMLLGLVQQINDPILMRLEALENKMNELILELKVKTIQPETIVLKTPIEKSQKKEAKTEYYIPEIRTGGIDTSGIKIQKVIAKVSEIPDIKEVINQNKNKDKK